MGMYTEFHFNSSLRDDVPKEVLDILHYMLGEWDDDTTPPETPDHSMFATSRWRFMLCMSSYYFDADTSSTLRFDDISGQYYLCIRCSLKNYDGEIQKFCDWMCPYLDKFDGEFLGFLRYEETEFPTLIFHGDIPCFVDVSGKRRRR